MFKSQRSLDFPFANICLGLYGRKAISASEKGTRLSQFSLASLRFLMKDFEHKAWVESAAPEAPFDAIVSGFAIHHQSHRRKRELHAEIDQLLKLGGIFLNLEHVVSLSTASKQVFNDLFVDALYRFHSSQGSTRSRLEIAREYYHRPDYEANQITPVEIQCNWLREIGFVDVECFMKLLEIALFAGVSPPLRPQDVK